MTKPTSDDREQAIRDVAQEFDWDIEYLARDLAKYERNPTLNCKSNLHVQWILVQTRAEQIAGTRRCQEMEDIASRVIEIDKTCRFHDQVSERVSELAKECRALLRKEPS